MRLVSCHVANFGVLQDASYDFTDGLNVVLEANGTGKSTLAAFIKAMFYGLAATTKRDLDANERKRYAPWQGGTFGGSLVFCADEKTYRIERSFGATTRGDSFCLYDVATGLACADYSANIGEELFGVDAASYEKSVWHPQKAVSFTQSAALTAKLSGGKEGADASVYEQVKKELEARISRYENKAHRGLLPDARAKKTHLEGEIGTCEAALARLSDLSLQLQGMLSQQKAMQSELETVKARRLAIHEVAERLARLETWQMLSSRVEQHGQNLANMLESFGGDAPQMQEIHYMRGILQQALSAREQSQTAMRYEDISRLAALREKFADGVPDELELQELLRDASRLDHANEQMEQTEASLVTRRAQLAATFPEGVPTQAACAAAGQMALGILQQEAEAVRASERAKYSAQKKKKYAVIASAALAAAGIGLLFFKLWVGLAGIAAGLILLLFALLGIKPALDMQQNIPMRDELLTFLRRYEQNFGGEDLLEGQLRVQQIARRAGDYEALGEELRAVQLRGQSIGREKAEFSARLAAMGQDVSDGFTPAVTALMDAASQYRALQQVRDESRARMAEASRQAYELEQKLSAFCRRYAKDQHGEAEDILPIIAQRAQAYEALVQAHAQAKAELAAYENLQNISGLTRTKPVDPEEKAALEARETELTHALSTLSGEIGMVKKEADDLGEYVPRLQSLQAELKQTADQIAAYEQSLGTLMQTAHLMQQAYDSMRANYLTLMQKGLQKYASLVTGQEAEHLHIDADFAVTADVQGQLRNYAHFSRGQKDIFDICTRLALCDALFEKQKPFLVLDDPFANLDDENLHRARILLERLAQDHQILYLACHSSRA